MCAVLLRLCFAAYSPPPMQYAEYQTSRSGAYIFRPAGLTELILDVKVSIVTGELMSEIAITLSASRKLVPHTPPPPQSFVFVLLRSCSRSRVHSDDLFVDASPLHRPARLAFAPRSGRRTVHLAPGRRARKSGGGRPVRTHAPPSVHSSPPSYPESTPAATRQTSPRMTPSTPITVSSCRRGTRNDCITNSRPKRKVSH
jgi:hypothetical protein